MNEFTSVIAALVAFAVTGALGFLVIPYLRKLKFGQTILDIGPNWHKEKQGTPTMGGIMIIAGVLLGVVIAFSYSAFTNGRFSAELTDMHRLTNLLSGLVMAIMMSGIGFMDDYIKVVKKRNLGLTAKQKTFLQLLIAAAYLLSLYLGGMKITNIPFIGDVDITSGLGLVFWPIALMFICAFMLGATFLYNISMSILAAALAGACVGFICWNAKPAKVFMGDTGSMFLGGMVVALSFGIERPVLLIFAGCTYFLEAISDIIQVAYYKKTKKRIFKMAPLHHHFEMCGWSEQKIVFVFSLITVVGCVIALLPIILML